MNKLKVLHLIDSLALGGAERVAVNMVNELSVQGVEAHLCATRKGGALQEFLSDDIKFSILNKRGTFDLAAMWRLIKYIKNNKIQIVHAHSSSIYLAAMVKLFCGFKLVWHWHSGAIINQVGIKKVILQLISKWSNYVYTVNDPMKRWAITEVGIPIQKIEYLSNFPSLDITNMPLKNVERELRIVVLSNLRYPKDHFTLVKAIAAMQMKCKLICVGRYYNDEYYTKFNELIRSLNITDRVDILGQRSDIANILTQCDIAVLSSSSEGLPVSLLEYGLAGLPVVCTNVGECATVLENGKHGILVESGDHKAMAEAIYTLAKNKEIRGHYAHSFQNHVNKVYSKEAIIKGVINRYNILLDGK